MILMIVCILFMSVYYRNLQSACSLHKHNSLSAFIQKKINDQYFVHDLRPVPGSIRGNWINLIQPNQTWSNQRFFFLRLFWVYFFIQKDEWSIFCFVSILSNLINQTQPEFFFLWIELCWIYPFPEDGVKITACF